MTAKLSIAAAAMVASASVLAPAVALAAEPSCPSGYGQKCPNVKPSKIVRPPEVQGQRFTLPFTGAEIVLMTVAGGGAIGAGTAFVVAGRRRRSATA